MKPVLTPAHQGYIYQDILGAYFVAKKIASGNTTSRFDFDIKKTKKGIPDRFDDITIYENESVTYIQVKYGSGSQRHSLIKNDFSSDCYGLALDVLFQTWQDLNQSNSKWHVCLAWDKPVDNESILDVLSEVKNCNKLLPNSICYKFNCENLWPHNKEVISSWKRLKRYSTSINRTEFKEFLDSLIIEINCPKTSLLRDLSKGIELLLSREIEKIGVGEYPNDHVNVREIAERLCSLTRRLRAENSRRISISEIEKDIGLISNHGGIEQKFPVDFNMLVDTPDRINQVVSALDEYKSVVLTAEPGSGKSWFIENLSHSLKNTIIVKHYCYVALEDPLATKRITVNALYGSLMTQILNSDENLPEKLTKRYASNLEQLNLLLKEIKKKTLIIVDGLDHIWRVYQKNRGGITEDETAIIKALGLLELNNPNVTLLVISQPIKNLAELTSMYHCSLSPITERFVEKLLEKNNINNIEIDEVKLSNKIYKKCNGNGLYCKYLIDHASLNPNRNSFDWMLNLPAYDYNLKGYYEYLYEQIKPSVGIPYALCGADFSLSLDDLKEITGLGNFVTRHLGILSPILKFKPKFGYSIYHESFKRYVIELIKKEGVSIDRIVYKPIISWLERFPFYESTKSYGHLLKLYFELDDFKAISKTISIDFIEKSLFYAQPISVIKQNHLLQRSVLGKLPDFEKIIILSEQSKIIYDFDYINQSTYIQYLRAVEEIHNDEVMYRALWNEEEKLIKEEDIYTLLIEQVHQKKEIIHWSISGEVPKLIPFEILGEVSIRYIHTKEYDKFNHLFNRVVESKEPSIGIRRVLSEVEWYCMFFGTDWLKETPLLRRYVNNTPLPKSGTLIEAIKNIINDDRFVYQEDWRILLEDIVSLSKGANEKNIDEAIKLLSDYNWFRNWLIYLIKISSFKPESLTEEGLINAFSYLVRDLNPFRGEPRTTDLYGQHSYILKSFHKGLLLCNDNNDLLIKCSDLLEKVTQTVTSYQNSYSGPLTETKFLNIIEYYLPSNYVLSKYEDYYSYLENNRMYDDIARISFEYSRFLNQIGKKEKAFAEYEKGIKSLTAYGFRKDRTLSEILYCSSPYQLSYNSLNEEWFYNLYQLAVTVVTHTDGKSTKHYPVEWFEEFMKVFPDEALRVLISETIEGDQLHWWQEEQFKHLIRKNADLFTPIQWFLLIKTLPLEHSEDIIDIGLNNIEIVDENIRKHFFNWLELIPNINLDYKRDNNKYSKDLSEKYRLRIGNELLPIKESRNRNKRLNNSNDKTEFPNSSTEGVLEFLDSNELTAENLNSFCEVVNKAEKLTDKRGLILKYVEQFKYGGYSEDFSDELFEVGTTEWVYLKIYLFVYVTDGWGGLMHHSRFFKDVYNFDCKIAIDTLMKVLGELLSKPGYVRLASCNLVKTLSQVKHKEEEVNPLIKLTYKLVEKRLPYPPNLDINFELLNDLKDLNRDELVVALLIARLKTLTTQRTQGIIWSLTYIAKTSYNSLFKPFSWAFSNKDYLLPIHRAVLLQILRDYVDKVSIPDDLIAILISDYPSGYFLEDQLIRYFIDYKIDFDENFVKSVIYNNHKHDNWFLSYLHVKYYMLTKNIGTLYGSCLAYEYERDEISKKYTQFYHRSEKLITPITLMANIAYKIVNNHYYEKLCTYFDAHYFGYTFNLEFFIDEILLSVGSRKKRPVFIPSVQNLPLYEVRKNNEVVSNEKWCVLGLEEIIIVGGYFENKKQLSSSITLVESTNSDTQFSNYLFKIERFGLDEINQSDRDFPLCKLEIKDTLESNLIIFVSPWVMKELDLTLHRDFHQGLRALNNNGDVIIKMINWKEDYLVSVSDSVEVPKREGVAVLIRTDYYDRLLDLYEGKCQFIFKQNDDGKRI